MIKTLKIRIAFCAACLLTAASLHADVRNGLVAYWPLNTASGAYPMTTPDVVGGNDLTGPAMDSGSAMVPGHFGNAITFDGSVNYLTLTTLPGTDTGLPVSAQGGSWTVALWVNGLPQAGGNYYFDESSDVNGTPLTVFRATANTNNSGVYVRDTTGYNPVNFPAVTNISIDGTWHHVAMTYDIGSHAFLHYVDGSLVYSNNFVISGNSGVMDLVNLGIRNRAGVGDLFFAGSLDDVALWGRALSQSEIQSVMTSGISTPVPQFAPVITANPVGSTNLYGGDNFTLSGTTYYGTRPFSFQWLKNGTNYPGGTNPTLLLSSVTTNDTGAYQLVISNSVNSATSAVAQITVKTFGSPNLTNGIVAYWPLDTITGTKTPDLVSAYDLTVGGTVNPTLTSGKWGNGMSFSAASSQYATRLDNPGEALPVYSLPDFTLSLWIKALPSAANTYFFGDGSTASTLPCFLLGTPGGDNKLFSFVRNNGGGTLTSSSTSVLLDNTWHNVVWVQHNAGGTPVAQWYIDGVLDATTPGAVYPLTDNRTTLGCFFRTAGQGFFTGALDEVVVWNRSLSAAEIGLIQSGYITNPPSRLTPLVVNSFKSDLPAVASGDSTVLRWDVPGNATQVLLSGLGDVTSKTVGGLGSTNLSPTVQTRYVLTVRRGAEQVQATNTIGVVSGVTTNWHLLDNFDFYSPGDLAANGWWVDVGTGGNSVSVVTPTNSNRMVKTMTTTSAAYLKLNNLTVNSNESRTLFFRMIPRAPEDLATTRNIVGITDRQGSREYQFNSGNMGPAVYPAVNDPSQNPGDWLIAARDMPYSALTYATNVLDTNVVYNVWIDITNVPVGDGSYPGHEDMFSVYLQKEGDAERTCILTNFTSDRDNTFSDTFTPLATDPLKLIFLCGNRPDQSALFDDFYLSKSGYNATIPRAFGYAGPSPTLQLQKVGGQWQVIFQGALQAAPAVTGTYTNVPDATSPYTVPTTGGTRMFYRSVSQ